MIASDPPTVVHLITRPAGGLQDYQDFQRLYAEGTVDFARIWLGKEERHQCLVEEGAPH